MRRLLSFMLVLCTLVCAGLLASCGNAAADNSETSDRPADKETAFQAETDSESAKESETEKVKTADYDYVALIGVDGSGNAFQEVDSPNYDAIFENGAVKLDSRAMDPTNSAENWASMLHGVLPSKHRRNNTNTGQEAYPEGSAYPSLFALLHEQRPQALTASFVNWNNINFGIVENNIGVHKQNIGSDASLTDFACFRIEQITVSCTWSDTPSLQIMYRSSARICWRALMVGTSFAPSVGMPRWRVITFFRGWTHAWSGVSSS